MSTSNTRTGGTYKASLVLVYRDGRTVNTTWTDNDEFGLNEQVSDEATEILSRCLEGLVSITITTAEAIS